jgi:predicted RNA-binding protein with PIN domain
MKIIIDGYNMLKSVFAVDFITDTQRNAAINKLQRYAQKKNHEIMIVFDGGPHSWPVREQHNEVTIIFSGYSMTADEYIQDYLSKTSPTEILLVTSDRALTNAAAHHGVISIDSRLFYSFVQRAVEKKAEDIPLTKSVQKWSNEDSQELDALMLTMPIVTKDEDLHSRQNWPVESTLSKHEKKLQAILKKL